MSSSRALLLSILALSALAFAYAFQTPAVPKALSADADPRDFSGHRALLHIQNIAREPRPTGSSSLARARVYLIGALRAASPRFQIEVQDGLVVESFLPGVANATRVKNIVARLPGTNSTRTLLLLAHYDSVVNSPGANDDGAGVATALELVRSLAARGANRNDIVVLLTDGEERGMLGARAYYQQHTRGSDPAIVFNFEARGNSGPALLFQSGAKSEWLVREFARFAKSPAASSVAQELFRILPYGTDFSVFAKGGQPGLNFAYINNTIYYHSAFDTPESVDVGSLQHHGDNVLELLVHLAALDLSETPADSKLGPSPTYFLAGRELIVYSHRWNGWLLGLAWLMYLACFARGIRCGRLREFAWQLSAPLIVAAASALFVWGLWRGLVLNVHPEMTAILPTGETYRAGFFKASLQCAGIAFGLWFYIAGFVRRSRGPFPAMSGGTGFWLLAATLATLYAPGAAHIFLWPLLAALTLCAVVLVRRGDGPLRAGDVPVLLSGLPVLALLFAPIIRFLFFGLIPTTAQALTMVVYGPWLFFLALPLSADAARSPRRAVFAVLAILSCVLFFVGGQAAAFGAEQPRPNSLFYIYDSGAGRLARFSCDARLDDWTRSQLNPPAAASVPALGEYLPILHACLPGLHRPAGAVLNARTWRDAGISGPVAEPVADLRQADGERAIKLRIGSRRAAPQMYAFLKSAGEIRELRVDGVLAPAPRLGSGSGPIGVIVRRLARRLVGGAFDLDGWSGVMLASSGKADFLLSFSVGGGGGAGAPIQLKLVDHTNGLSAAPESGGSPVRPPGFAPGGRFPFADGVFVVSDYHF